MADSAAVTFGPDAPYLELADQQWAAGTMTVQCQYQIVAATGTYASTGTISSSQPYTATVDTFKGAAAVGAQNQLAWIRA